MIALDQLDQTVEVMGAVIKRLKRNLNHALPLHSQRDTSSPTFDFASLLDHCFPDHCFPDNGFSDNGFPDNGFPDNGFPDKGWH